MSGIYIPGMEMPKSCCDCPCANGDRMRCQVAKRDFGFFEDTRPDWCPLVPVPPHGELVDRTEMREIAISLLNEAVTDQEADAIRKMWSHLGQMPVFIPAEEEE